MSSIRRGYSYRSNRRKECSMLEVPHVTWEANRRYILTLLSTAETASSQLDKCLKNVMFYKSELGITYGVQLQFCAILSGFRTDMDKYMSTLDDAVLQLGHHQDSLRLALEADAEDAASEEAAPQRLLRRVRGWLHSRLRAWRAPPNYRILQRDSSTDADSRNSSEEGINETDDRPLRASLLNDIESCQGSDMELAADPLSIATDVEAAHSYVVQRLSTSSSGSEQMTVNTIKGRGFKIIPLTENYEDKEFEELEEFEEFEQCTQIFQDASLWCLDYRPPTTESPSPDGNDVLLPMKQCELEAPAHCGSYSCPRELMREVWRQHYVLQDALLTHMERLLTTTALGRWQLLRDATLRPRREELRMQRADLDRVIPAAERELLWTAAVLRVTVQAVRRLAESAIPARSAQAARAPAQNSQLADCLRQLCGNCWPKRAAHTKDS